MDISMNQIDKLTLDYFTNKTQYRDLIEKRDIFQSKEFINDKRFYRKRILNITRELFANKIKNPELKNTFNHYIKSIINYLKFIDKKDILQEEYLDLSLNEVDKKVYFEKIEQDDIDSLNNANSLMINSDYKKINSTLDDFVIKKTNEKQEKEIEDLPKKKVINLKNPDLKKKGIKKKKKENLNS